MVQRLRSDNDPTPRRPSAIMHLLARLMPANPSGENVRAVATFRYVDLLRDLAAGGPLRRLAQGLAGRPPWPIVSGAYLVGDPSGSVAVCTPTSGDLVRPATELPAVAIAGRVYTPNLGIEKIILNVTANPRIRFLLVCGKESPVFFPGQALRALFADGVTDERRIVGARGHVPVLGNVARTRIEVFRKQVELVDRVGELDVDAIGREVAILARRDPGPYTSSVGGVDLHAVPEVIPRSGREDPRFVPIRVGGKREPLAYDPRGFFVIAVERALGEIVVRHYDPDNSPAHVVSGRTGESILLGLLREDLVSQLSHAGYLGAELAKAETALRLGLPYEQDRPLRPGK